MPSEPPILNVHTPTSSFAVVHSLTQESLEDLYDKLSRKAHTTYRGERVGPGWLKYEFNQAIWNLDDDSDYTIFVWRQQQQPSTLGDLSRVASSSSASDAFTVTPYSPPTLHLHNPLHPLPTPPAYLNASYYLFQPSRAHAPRSHKSPSPTPRSSKSRKTKGSKRGTVRTSSGIDEDLDPNTPKFKMEFERFHSENGVRTVVGSIGPVQNVRMLLKSGYRHVYISRKFAMKHGFIPSDAAPGHYGYGGLVNIGTWPITLTSTIPPPAPKKKSAHPAEHTHAVGGSVSMIGHADGNTTPTPTRKPKSTRRSAENGNGHQNGHAHNGHPHAGSTAGGAGGPKPVNLTVFLSEEPHFDVVLGRSFFERRQIRTSTIDPTDVVCLDTGEKIECELVILKDGRGEIVTVT